MLISMFVLFAAAHISELRMKEALGFPRSANMQLCEREQGSARIRRCMLYVRMYVRVAVVYLFIPVIPEK